MILCDFKREFERAFLRYLLEEVTIEPLTDISLITFTMGAIHLVKGEETKIPRWLAELLEERGKVRIVDNEIDDPRKLSAMLINYAYGTKTTGIDEIRTDIYMKIYDLLSKYSDPETRAKIKDSAKLFMSMRKPRITTLVFEKDEHNVIWEDVLFKFIKQCIKEWEKTIIQA